MLKIENTIFEINSETDFEEHALLVYRQQFTRNVLYRQWCTHLRRGPSQVKKLSDIPFLPITFFKEHRVLSAPESEKTILFTSSGTTGSVTAKHIVTDPELYETSFFKTFEIFYGDPAQYCILALLPGYLERKTSSLVYMVQKLIEVSKHPDAGFYLRDQQNLLEKIRKLKVKGQKVLLIGVSYALLDLCELDPQLGPNFIVMETGGMKGTRREMLKPELHETLKKGLGVDSIHSEYGMTELLSQAYSRGDGLFEGPPWMRFLIRETDDPLKYREDSRTGGINVIDLANINSCAFIATQDLGRLHENGKLELMGRFDNSDVRGCNLMLGGL